MGKVNNVLWTGGWDSTFRVIELYRLGATIQPIYVLDPSRKSAIREMDAIHKITEGIPVKFMNSNAKILPLKLIKRNEVRPDLFIKFIHKVLRYQMKLGKQYYWLACIAKEYKHLELSLHEEDIYRFFSLEQLIQFNDGTIGQNWRIDPKKINFFKRHLFSNMTFPIVTISKPEMKRISEENNFFDLMELTWFCHKSNEKPCGKCNPCKQYIKHGFGFRLQ